MDLIDIMDLIDRYVEKMREKEREKKDKRQKKREKREKRREKERRTCPGSIIINLHSAINSQKDKLNILAELLKISKSCCLYHHDLYRAPSL